MNTSLIHPPFSEDDVHELLKTPVAIFVNGQEKKRGRIISVNTHPADKKYSVVLDVDFSEYEGCTLGFIEKTKHWIFTEAELNDHIGEVTKPFTLELKYAASIIYAKD